MDALKAEAQKIMVEIEEFTSRSAKEMAGLVKEISSIEDANDKMVKRARCIDAEAETLAKEKEEIKLALIENDKRLERLSHKKKEMEEMMDSEMRKLMERDAEVREILGRLSSGGPLKQENTPVDVRMVEFLKKAVQKKEEDLICPICLETAKPPIFMCQDSHIICSICAPKVRTCPECRVELPTPLKRHRFAEKTSLDLDDLLQQLVELTGSDPDPEQGPQGAQATELEPLSAPQATFEHDDYTFSNCSLLHKLLITGQGEQVESRRGELDRYLLSTTCDIKYPRMTVSMIENMDLEEMTAEYEGISKATPLHLAVYFESSTTVVSTLIQAGANVDALNSDQLSPLHHASALNPAVVPVLIGAGCKVNLLDVLKLSPLYYAARWSKDQSAVAALMSAGADPHLGNSPLTDSSVSKGMKDYIRSLSK